MCTLTAHILPVGYGQIVLEARPAGRWASWLLAWLTKWTYACMGGSTNRRMDGWLNGELMHKCF